MGRGFKVEGVLLDHPKALNASGADASSESFSILRIP